MSERTFDYKRISNEEYEVMKSEVMDSEEHVIYNTCPNEKGTPAPEFMISQCMEDAKWSFPDEEVIQIWYSEVGIIFKTRKKESV